MSSLRSQGRALAGLMLSTLLTSGCEPPPVVATDDQQQQTRAARIEGSVVVQGPARGNAVVFLYDAQRPPPPQGTGRPVAFTLVPQAVLFGSDLSKSTTGPFTAPFVFPLVRPGSYLLRGFIDTDTCRTDVKPCHGPDFIPWYNVTAEPNLWDVAGASVDPATRIPRVIEVGETGDGTPIPVTGITVSFSEVATVAADRPAFDVVGSATIDPNGGNQSFKLRARPIREGVVDLSAPVFLVRFMDENRDNVPDDANRDGAPDLWPRVLIRKLADGGNGLTDENDLDNNGVIDAQGADYVHADGTVDGQPDLVVIPTVLLADPLLSGLYDSENRPKMDAVVPTPELTVAFRPMAVDVSNPAVPKTLRAVPAGRYAVIVLQSTGQVWRVPNELSPQLAGGLGLPPIDGQGFSFQVR
ncbi:hypothetical protein [Hyalangium sp.]|uniref:hypothetical protein n=1 Tax=Hyalangium sp. TaxID=2028555 RepID=UPI002D75643C|nr:hypothetical protein [Hyalangium sp.]HYH99597.1 hypothetical protein [Hyalangium sp.]